MHRSSASRLTASVVSVLAGFLLVGSSAFAANKIEKKNSGKFDLKTYFPTKVMVSRPLRDHLTRPKPGQAGKLEAGKDRPPKLVKAPANVPRPLDPAIKSRVFPPNMPDPI